MNKQNHLVLKKEQDEKKHQLNTLMMEVSALRIKSDHLEKTLKMLQDQSYEELIRNQTIKPNVLEYAERALYAQEPADFPKEFLTTIFAMHSDDPNFRDHCQELDIELSKAVMQMGEDAYQTEKQCINEIKIHKMKSVREKLNNKYKAKQMRKEQEDRENLVLLKDRCFILLKQFIIEHTRSENEQYIKSFLKHLKHLYAQESEDP